MTSELFDSCCDISWDTFHRDVEALAQKLALLGPWEKIIAVTRGGLVPAGYLAQHLDIRLVDTVCLASYSRDHSQGDLITLKSIKEDGKKTLVIDDLSDSGKTLGLIARLLPQAHRAVVYVKPSGQKLVETFARVVDQDTWLVFPWEVAPH